MPYRLKSGEAVADGVRRIATEELESAAELLAHATAATRDEAIHEARKSIKKTRALLRLMRPEIDRIYAVENRRLRDLGRRLSEYRDATAIIETFDVLLEKYRDELGDARPSSVRRALTRARRAQQTGARIRPVLKRMSAAFTAAAKRASRWPLGTDGFSAVGPGLTAAYRTSRKAMARVNERPRADLVHEWRKRAKDHWYHVRLIEDVWTEVMQGYETSLKELETWLGDHHNLEVLREKLTASPETYGKPEDIERFLEVIAKFQKELLANAASLGERLHEQRPGQYREMIEGLWASWQAAPKSLRKFEKEQRAAGG